MGGHPLILFDGLCGLCSASVLFILARDRQARFQFAPLQSRIGRETLARLKLFPADADTMVLIEDGRTYLRSTAALRICRGLSWPWPIFYIFMLAPRPLRDALYRFVSRNRFRWFGRRDSFPPSPPDWKDRFLAD